MQIVKTFVLKSASADALADLDPTTITKPPLQQQKMAFAGATKSLGERRLQVIISSQSEDRDGDIVLVKGIDISSYVANPVVLFQHNSNMPIARCIGLEIRGTQMIADVQFPPAGVCEKSDEVYGLIQAEVLNAASIGFLPKDYEARDKSRPYSGNLFKKVELFEFSIVSIPSNRDALVISRTFGIAEGDFVTWEQDGAMKHGKVQGLTEGELDVEIWELGEKGWLSAVTTTKLADEKATKVKSLAMPEQNVEIPACPDEEEQAKSEQARLRGVTARKLRVAIFQKETTV